MNSKAHYFENVVRTDYEIVTIDNPINVKISITVIVVYMIYGALRTDHIVINSVLVIVIRELTIYRPKAQKTPLYKEPSL